MNLNPETLRALLADSPALEYRLLQLTVLKKGETNLTPSAQGIIVGGLLALAVQDGHIPCDELDLVLVDTVEALRKETPRDLSAESWRWLDGWTLTLQGGRPCLSGRDELGLRIVTSPVLRFQGANLAITLRSVYRLGTPA